MNTVIVVCLREASPRVNNDQVILDTYDEDTLGMTDCILQAVPADERVPETSQVVAILNEFGGLFQVASAEQVGDCLGRDDLDNRLKKGIAELVVKQAAQIC